MKKIGLFLSIISFCSNVFAQEIEYNKRKNNYKVGDSIIAKLDTKGNGFGYSRSFFIQNLNEKNLITFNFIVLKDTFDISQFYFKTDIPDLNLACTVEVPDDLNAEKHFANLPLKFKMLNLDGSLNEENCKKFVYENSYNHQLAFEKRNDSLKALVSGPRNIVKRNTRNAPYADNMNRIGQGDDVIGSWEKQVIPVTQYGEVKPPEIYYHIKNLDGTLLARIKKGSTDYMIFDKKRLIKSLNPGATNEFKGTENEILIINRISEELVNRGML